MPSFKTKIAALLIIPCALSACASFDYYSQSISGHIEVLGTKQPISTYLASGKASSDEHQKLTHVLKLLEFARTEMLLPDNGSYQTYSDIERDFVIWNVFATPALSLRSEQWCYLFIGCLAYRGYYAKEDATTLANSLRSQNYDVYMGGVAAYSTLGWFSDPVLNTMLRWDKLYLTRVIFHELAHQKIYIKNDTEFNEAFAEAVASIATRRWLKQHGSEEEYAILLEQEGYEQEFIRFISLYKNKLMTLYDSDLPDSRKLTEKENIFAELSRAYITLSQDWENYRVYDRWIKDEMNNAKLTAFTTYREIVPAFLQMYEATGQDLKTFYSHIVRLSQCDYEQRRLFLNSPPENITC